MDSKIIEKLIDLFWEGLSDYSSDVWFDSSSNEKEELLWWALEKFDEPIDKEEALDIFWQWADGLEEDSFIDFSDTATHNVAEDLHGHSSGYNIIEFSDKVGWDSSARDWARALINTLEDASIRILDYYEDRNFCDFKVNQHGDIITYRVRPGGEVTIRMHEADTTSFADAFELYENLWDEEANSVEEKLISLFWDGLRDYSSDAWFDSSTKEKEEILWWALEQLNEPIEKDKAIDLFWTWADGLEEDSFIDFN